MRSLRILLQSPPQLVKILLARTAQKGLSSPPTGRLGAEVGMLVRADIQSCDDKRHPRGSSGRHSPYPVPFLAYASVSGLTAADGAMAKIAIREALHKPAAMIVV